MDLTIWEPEFKIDIKNKSVRCSMNKVIEKFGEYIYKKAGEDPKTAREILTSVYSLSGLQAKYFPSKALMPSRQYMMWVSAKSITTPLRRPERAAIVSIFTPCEILHAAGIVPMFPEGLSCYLAASASERYFVELAEKNGVPESLCSYHKILIGLVESGVMPKPLFILNTTLACDANQLSFRRAAEYFKIPRYVIDVPMSSDEKSAEYVENQLREIWEKIKDFSEEKNPDENLRAAAERSRRTIDNYKKYLDLRASRYISDEMTSEMLSVFAMHVLLGTRESEEYTRRLCEDTAKKPEGFRGKRILWVHSLPYWQDSLREIFNFNERCEIISCDMTFDSLETGDTENPFAFMAKRTVSCSFNGGWERRSELCRELAEKMHADGIIYFCHWGCKQTMGACVLAKKNFERSGFPTLILDGDGCDRRNISDGQMVTRVTAFLEQLESGGK